MHTQKQPFFFLSTDPDMEKEKNVTGAPIFSSPSFFHVNILVWRLLKLSNTSLAPLAATL